MMKHAVKLVSVKGKRIQKLADAVERLRPGVVLDVNVLKKLKDEDELKMRLTAFFSMRGFNDDEQKEIFREVYPVPFKLFLYIALILILLVFMFKFSQFYNQPRIYAIGNNITAMSSAGDQMQINLFGVDPAGNSTPYSMIVLDSSGNEYKASSDNFFNWMFSVQEQYTIQKDAVAESKDEYKSYVRIFSSLLGTSELGDLDVKDRKIIKSVVDTDPVFSGAVIDVRDTVKIGYKRLLKSPWPIGSSADSISIFLAFKTSDGKIKNVNLRFDQMNSHTIEPIECAAKSFNEPLLWQDGSAVGAQPTIYFLMPSQSQSCISVRPPYKTFVPWNGNTN